MRPACAASIPRPRPRQSDAPELMDVNAQDAYEQFSDASTTPIWDLIIGLATVATVLGGGLAGVYAVGYLGVGRTSLAWPLLEDPRPAPRCEPRTPRGTHGRAPPGVAAGDTVCGSRTTPLAAEPPRNAGSSRARRRNVSSLGSTNAAARALYASEGRISDGALKETPGSAEL